MLAADKQALWDAYLAASENQNSAEVALLEAQEVLDNATARFRFAEQRADDAYEAWENA